MSILIELSNTVQKQVEKEYEYSPVRGVAHQLMDIVGQDEQAAAIVLEDLKKRTFCKRLRTGNQKVGG